MSQQPAAAPRSMTIFDTIYARRAVRQFTTEPVAPDTIRQLIDAAVQAPSAVNEQPWSFSVVRDPALLARMSNESKSFMLRKPPAGIPAQHIQELLTDPNFDIFYHAPVLIVISSTIQDQWTIENCSLAAQNLMLVAAALGLGTCWIGFAQMWLSTPEGKAALQLPTNYVPVAPIIVGHPKVEPPRVHRKEPEIHWIG